MGIVKANVCFCNKNIDDKRIAAEITFKPQYSRFIRRAAIHCKIKYIILVSEKKPCPNINLHTFLHSV